MLTADETAEMSERDVAIAILAKLDQVADIAERLDMLEAGIKTLSMQIGSLTAITDKWGPMLDMLAPGSGATDIQRAGMIRSMRAAWKKAGG